MTYLEESANVQRQILKLKEAIPELISLQITERTNSGVGTIIRFNFPHDFHVEHYLNAVDLEDELYLEKMINNVNREYEKKLNKGKMGV